MKFSYEHGNVGEWVKIINVGQSWCEKFIFTSASNSLHLNSHDISGNKFGSFTKFYNFTQDTNNYRFTRKNPLRGFCLAPPRRRLITR